MLLFSLSFLLLLNVCLDLFFNAILLCDWWGCLVLSHWVASHVCVFAWFNLNYWLINCVQLLFGILHTFLWLSRIWSRRHRRCREFSKGLWWSLNCDAPLMLTLFMSDDGQYLSLLRHWSVFSLNHRQRLLWFECASFHRWINLGFSLCKHFEFDWRCPVVYNYLGYRFNFNNCWWWPDIYLNLVLSEIWYLNNLYWLNFRLTVDLFHTLYSNRLLKLFHFLLLLGN